VRPARGNNPRGRAIETRKFNCRLRRSHAREPRKLQLEFESDPAYAGFAGNACHGAHRRKQARGVESVLHDSVW